MNVRYFITTIFGKQHVLSKLIALNIKLKHVTTVSVVKNYLYLNLLLYYVYYIGELKTYVKCISIVIYTIENNIIKKYAGIKDNKIKTTLKFQSKLLSDFTLAPLALRYKVDKFHLSVVSPAYITAS